MNDTSFFNSSRISFFQIIMLYTKHTLKGENYGFSNLHSDELCVTSKTIFTRLISKGAKSTIIGYKSYLNRLKNIFFRYQNRYTQKKQLVHLSKMLFQHYQLVQAQINMFEQAFNTLMIIFQIEHIKYEQPKVHNYHHGFLKIY